MNQHARIEAAAAGISPEEWQARVDLAAVYRLCAHYGWDDVIYNHCSMRVPGDCASKSNRSSRAPLASPVKRLSPGSSATISLPR